MSHRPAARIAAQRKASQGPAPPLGTLTSADSRRDVRLWGGLLVLLTLAAYLPALTADFIWDDDAYVTNNPVLPQPDGLRRIWFELGATDQFYPLVYTTFWVEYRLWGLNPIGYHLVNMLLHGLGTVLLWRLLRRLEVPGAWLAAAIFAVHPVHVESVAWVTERKNVLSLVFYLGAAMAYLRFAPLDEGNDASPGAARRDPLRLSSYMLSLGLFACALLSKTATVAFPIAVLLIIWWKRGRVGVRDIVPLVPFFAASLVAGLVTSSVETHHVGAGELEWTLSIPQRCLLAGRALCFYTWKLAWPAGLAFVYGRWEIDPADWREYPCAVAVVSTLIALWVLRKRIGRGPLTAAAFFTVSLLPTLGFVKFYFMNYSFVADHFQYLASIGPIVLFATILTWVAQRMRTPVRRAAIRGLQVVIVGVLAVLTAQRCRVFRNNETLWNDVLVKRPAARCMAYQNLGTYYFNLGQLGDLGRFEDAARNYLDGLRIESDYPDAHQNLAVALQQLGRTDEAIHHEHEAIRLLGPRIRKGSGTQGSVGFNRDVTRWRQLYVEAACNLGLMLEIKGRFDEAERSYQQAIELHPNCAVAHFNYARLLVRLGRNSDAVKHYREALRIDPSDTEAARELQALLANQEGGAPL